MLGEEQRAHEVRICSHANANSATSIISNLQESERRLREERRAREAAQAAQQVRMLCDDMAFAQ